MSEPAAATVVIVPISTTPPVEAPLEPTTALAHEEPVAEAAPAAEPVMPEPFMSEPVAPEPIAPAPAAEPVAEPVAGPIIQPIVIGDAPAPSAEKKRGWWRR